MRDTVTSEDAPSTLTAVPVPPPDGTGRRKDNRSRVTPVEPVTATASVPGYPIPSDWMCTSCTDLRVSAGAEPFGVRTVGEPPGKGAAPVNVMGASSVPDRVRVTDST
ncbi:hypothetical protein GA0115258_117568 [Streptomyces sp. LamerLS-31b]|nr:hypothetical protein GA0115258_117568 [Streptomyces sp. LamerLS-31b]